MRAGADLQHRVRACVLISGPATISILEGKEDVHAVKDALVGNRWTHQLVIQLC